MQANKSYTEKQELLRLFAFVLALYVLLVAGFRFLAGEQLLYRVSRGSIEAGETTGTLIELCEGCVVEQSFPCSVERLEEVGVRVGGFYRANAGTLIAELCRESDGAVLLSGRFDVSEIADSELLALRAEAPIPNMLGQTLILRLTADSEPGHGVAALCGAVTVSPSLLRVNGESADGALCFSLGGTDVIWTGLHYTTLAFLGGILLTLLLVIEWLCWRKRGRCFLLSAAQTLEHYRFLIRQLVLRDFKVRYKRSVLGVFWSVLNPLLMMLVQYVVFSSLFRSNIPYFAAYLLIGVVMFNFFSEATGLTLMSVINNAPLITKVAVPKIVYPLVRTLSSLINLVLSLIPLTVVCLLTGLRLHKAALLALFFFLCLVLFTLGLGILLSASMVFFRDTQFLWGVLSMMWTYLTPIFYPETIIPAPYRSLFAFNPLYHFIKNARLCLIGGISPEPVEYLRCLLIALAMLLFGIWVFRRHEDEYVLYL